jgi:hypothetical protein
MTMRPKQPLVLCDFSELNKYNSHLNMEECLMELSPIQHGKYFTSAALQPSNHSVLII